MIKETPRPDCGKVKNQKHCQTCLGEGKIFIVTNTDQKKDHSTYLKRGEQIYRKKT